MRRPTTDFSEALRGKVVAAIPAAGQVDLYDGEVTLAVMRLRVKAWPAIFIGYRGSDVSKQGRRREEALRFTLSVCVNPGTYEPSMGLATAAIIDDLLQALDGEILFTGGFPLFCERTSARDEFKPPLYSIECSISQTYLAKN